MQFIFFKQSRKNMRQQKVIEIQIRRKLLFFGFPLHLTDDIYIYIYIKGFPHRVASARQAEDDP